MTTQETKLFFEGKDYWYEYIKVNGYAFCPNEKGISKLSRLLDINKSHLKKRINVFLSA